MTLLAGSSAAIPPTGLAGAIFIALRADPSIAFGDTASGHAFCDQLASAIVAYVTSNAVVVAGTMANGAGPVVGTGTIA